jgi:hypothetical protein
MRKVDEKERRTVHIYSPFCRHWQPIKFAGLKKGMVFRLFEPDTKEQVPGTYIAVSDAYRDPTTCKADDCHTIKADPIENWD